MSGSRSGKVRVFLYLALFCLVSREEFSLHTYSVLNFSRR